MSSVIAGVLARPAAHAGVLPRRLTIFVPHGSHLLTDHMAHGDGLVAHGFLRELALRGHRLIVAVPEADLREPLPPSIELHVLGRTHANGLVHGLEYLARVRRLYAATARAHRIDLIHQLNPVVRGMSLSLLGAREPVVLGTYVGDWDVSHPDLETPRPSPAARAARALKIALDRAQQRRAAAILVTTPYALNRVPDARRLRERIFQVYHGVDERAFHPPVPRHDDAPSVLFLATMERYKGVYTLVDAFERVAERLPEATLRLAGGGADTERIRERLARSPFGTRMHVLGSITRDRVAQELRDADVLCLPSYSEPLGQSVLEAMATGLPVVITTAGGPSYVLPEQGGLRVPPGDSAALADALTQLLSSRALREAMGARNRATVLARYTWAAVVDRLEAVYAYVLGFAPEPPPRFF